MDYSASPYPLLHPELTAQPEAGQPGHVRVLRGERPTAAVLGNAAWRVAEEFDGSRPVSEIFRGLREEGIPVPSPDFIAALAGTLAKAGLVELLGVARSTPWRRYPPTHTESLHALRHSCQQCGRSCQGHLIGPLDEAFLERLPELRSQLLGDLPHLADYPLTEEVSVPDMGTLHALPQHRGRCVFLGEDNLCTIHARFGAAAKPYICRLFPLTLVQTETAIRIGTPLRCYFAHKARRDEPERSPAEIAGIPSDEFQAPSNRGADRESPNRLVLNPAEDSVYGVTQRVESGLLELLRQPGTTLLELLRYLLPLVLDEDLSASPQLQPDAFVAALVPHLVRLGQKTLDDPSSAARHPWPGTHNEQLALLCGFLTQLKPRTFPVLQAEDLELARFSLSEELFTREWTRMPSILTAPFVGACGALVAAWRAEDEPGPDTFAFTLTCWNRTVRAAPYFLYFLESDAEFRDLMSALRVAPHTNPEGASP